MGKSLAMLIEKFQIVMKRNFGNKKKRKSSSKLQSIQNCKSSFNFNLFETNKDQNIQYGACHDYGHIHSYCSN